MNIGDLLTSVAALSVATERVTELLKRIPGLSDLLSKRREGKLEDIRVMAVHILAILIGMILCYCFPTALPKLGQNSGSIPRWAEYLGFGLLASGGSSFWNSALDTFRGVKQKMGG